MWKIIDSGKGRAEQNMAIDAQLLKDLSPDASPILHFYDWEGECITHGCLLNPHNLLDMVRVKSLGINIVKRPTGGGIIFHLYDFAFSIIVPAKCKYYSANTLKNYHCINSRIKEAIKKCIKLESDPSFLSKDHLPLDANCAHFCMAAPTKYDLLVGKKKIVGAAQRRQKQGYLHQGSIAIALPKKDFLHKVLLPGTQVAEAMLQNTFFILKGDWKTYELQEVRATLKQQLQKEFTQ